MLDIKNKVITDKIFYKTLIDKNSYDLSTQYCIEETVYKLLQQETTQNSPGMLLGKIQSGKTRTFLGITGLAFDNGYDIAIVLTKGTKALAYQTYNRIKDEFSIFLENEKVQIFDIMHLPNNLTKYELNQKIIIIAKKQKDNLRRLEEAIKTTYPQLKKRRTLIIDDEADYASIGFKKTKKEIYEINTLAGQIDSIRKQFNRSDFLQVTATPYSLYLQPEGEIKLSGFTFRPTKPAFTVLVPHGSDYIGGEYYFQESQEDSTMAFYLHQPISENELEILKKPDRRRFKIEEALKSKSIKSLRNAIINFLVGSVIRRLQNEKRMLPVLKYSFIIHTEQKQASHAWQKEVVSEIIMQLTKAIDKEPLFFSRLIKDSYEHLSHSLNLLNVNIPHLDEVQYHTRKALENEYILLPKLSYL